jgi:hypothetical protein
MKLTCQKCNRTTEDLTGQVFGHLTVCGHVCVPDKVRPEWRCNCHCGLIWFVSAQNLKSKHTSSCPCQDTHSNQRAVRQVSQSGFIGVDHHHKSSIFRARICDQGKRITLGTYATAEEAAHAYDKAARELHGPNARVNFPVDKP